MSETAVYHRLKNVFAAGEKPVHFTRIENTLTSGTPDINVCSEGIEAWIEAKNLGKKFPTLRKAQFAWIYDHQKVGGIACVLNLDFGIRTATIWHGIEAEACDEKHVQITNEPDFTIYVGSNPNNKIVTNLWRAIFDWKRFRIDLTG